MICIPAIVAGRAPWAPVGLEVVMATVVSAIVRTSALHRGPAVGTYVCAVPAALRRRVAMTSVAR